MSSNRNSTVSSNRSQEFSFSRRNWIAKAAAVGLATGLFKLQPTGSLLSCQAEDPIVPDHPIRFGLVTYLWGKDMDVPTLINACHHAGLKGVELRTEHKHLVEPNLSAAERSDIRKRFEQSGIELIGYGSNCEFHSPNPDVVASNIQKCKEYIHLMHDCGGSGVKVKPNGFAKDVDPKHTIRQIGDALNELAEYGHQFGQQIRLEVHGDKTSHLSVVRDIFAVATHPNAVVCWNSNSEDLLPPGLAENFSMVQSRLGATTHVRELDLNDYPYQQLFDLLVDAKYTGWILLEARTDPADKFDAMKKQRAVFDHLIANAYQQKRAPK